MVYKFMEKKEIYTAKNGQCSVDEVGGKGYNLFMLSRSGFNVPRFFVIGTNVFQQFLRENGIQMNQLQDVSADEIMAADFSEDIKSKIMHGFTEAFAGEKVAVRSSATNEDAQVQSMAGKFSTVLYVDKSNILNAVKTVYASAFNAPHGGTVFPLMAVVVQKQIAPQKSGVAFAEQDNVVISGVIGDGEVLVSGRENGDTYIVSNGVDQNNYITPQTNASIGGGKQSLPPIVATVWYPANISSRQSLSLSIIHYLGGIITLSRAE